MISASRAACISSCAEPGNLLHDLRQLLVLSEQLLDVAADTVGREYSVWHGRRSFPSMTWPSLKGTYARLVIYTRIRTSPHGSELEMLSYGKVPNHLVFASLWTGANDARYTMVVGNPAKRLTQG